MEDPVEAETSAASEVETASWTSPYSIMTINMNGKNRKGVRDIRKKRRQLITSIIKCFPASVIFCQEHAKLFKTEVVAECGIDGYTYTSVTEVVPSGNRPVVMWRETDFQGELVKGTLKIVERLQEKDSDVNMNEVHTRTTLVKLTSKKTGASFLAVSWHGPWNKLRGRGKRSLESKLKTFNGLICFLCEVCKKEKLSSFIIGGDFNFDTSKEEHERVTISRYELCTRDKEQRDRRSFVPFKDTFIVSVTAPSDKRPLTGDITVSSVRPRDFEIKSNKEALLDHVPVVGDLILPWQVREDKSDKRTKEENRPDSTPETTARTAEVGSHASGARRKLDLGEDVSNPSSSQSPSAIDDGCITRKDFKELFSLVESLSKSLHAKVDRQADEIEKIKSAMQRLDGPHRGVSQPPPTEPHIQTRNVLVPLLQEQGSDGDNEENDDTNEKERVGDHYDAILGKEAASPLRFDREEDKSDKRTKEENRPDSTPETTARTAEVGSHASGARRNLDLGEDDNEENDDTSEKESESSMRAMGDHDNQIKLIESYVSRKLGKQRKTVPGDGHCMLHAFSLGLREKDDHSDYSVTALSTQIREEILGNIEFYSQFVGDKDRLVSDLDSYINDNKYDSEVVDLMLHALATVTNTSVSVLGVHEGQVHTLIIDPRGGGSKRTIFICKIGMHYDAILHQDEEAAICEESTEKYRQDTKKSHITKKTTNEKNRLELTPETTVRTAKASSSALGPRQLHFGEEVSNPSKSQSPSAIHDGCITGKDFEKLFNLVENLSKSVESFHAKVDRQTTEIVEIKSAMQRLDGPHTGVSQPPPTEPHSQTTNVLASPLLEQGSDRAEEQDALLTSGTKQRKVHTYKKCGKPVKGHRKDKNGSLVCPPDAEK